MANSLTEIPVYILEAFLEECRRETYSFSLTGMSFPIHDELLEYSLSSRDSKDYHNVVHHSNSPPTVREM